MSEIDVYKHECLGMIRCGKSRWHDDVWWIPIYRLDEDAKHFYAKAGDILVGGGSGETSALRISMPEALRWSTDDDYDTSQEVTETFWGTTDCYEFGVGYASEGWNPVRGNGTMDWFVTDHVLAFLLREYPEYQQYAGKVPLDRDGSICRLPTEQEREMGRGIIR